MQKWFFVLCIGSLVTILPFLTKEQYPVAMAFLYGALYTLGITVGKITLGGELEVVRSKNSSGSNKENSPSQSS